MERERRRLAVVVVVVVALLTFVTLAGLGTTGWFETLRVTQRSDFTLSETVDADRDDLVVDGDTAAAGITILSGAGTDASLAFQEDGDSDETFLFRYLATTDTLEAYSSYAGTLFDLDLPNLSGNEVDVYDADYASVDFKIPAVFESTFNAMGAGTYGDLVTYNTDDTSTAWKLSSSTGGSHISLQAEGDGELIWGAVGASADTSLARLAADQLGTASGDDLVAGADLWIGGVSGNSWSRGTSPPGTCSDGDVFSDTDGDGSTNCSSGECTVALCGPSNTWYYPDDAAQGACAVVSVPEFDPAEGAATYYNILDPRDVDASVTNVSTTAANVVLDWQAPRGVTVTDLRVEVDDDPTVDPGWQNVGLYTWNGTSTFVCSIGDGQTQCTNAGSATLTLGQNYIVGHGTCSGGCTTTAGMRISFCVR